jgi:hypothetical protein
MSRSQPAQTFYEKEFTKILPITRSNSKLALHKRYNLNGDPKLIKSQQNLVLFSMYFRESSIIKTLLTTVKSFIYRRHFV